MLLRLKRIEKAYPLDATEVRTKQGNNTAIFRIKDLTAAYKDIMGDKVNDIDKVDDPLMAVLKRWDDASSGK